MRSTFRSRSSSAGSASPSSRGTVLILVVAVLALLTVIGTVYLISARSEKASANATSTGVNLHWAQDGVMSSVAEVIGDAVIDSNGRIGGYTAGASPASRWYDYPDSSANTANFKSQPWLVINLHNKVSDYSFLAPTTYDPSNPTVGLASNAAMSNELIVVDDQTSSALEPINSDDPNTMPSGLPHIDGRANLLTFSDGSGIRYRYSVRILDTSRLANLNVGATDDGLATGDAQGVYVSSLRLAPTTNFPAALPYYNMADTGVNLHYNSSTGLGRDGLGAFASSFDLAKWQWEAMRFERPTDGPGGSIILPFFDLSDELDLRSYGEHGTTYHARPALGDGGVAYTLWPNTLSADANKTAASSLVVGNPSRRNYGTYTFSRDLRAYDDIPDTGANRFKLTLISPDTAYPRNITATTDLWPQLPARIAANPSASIYAGDTPNDVMFYTAMAASQIGTIMQNSTVTGFNPEETCSFIANYCTQRWNGFTTDPNVTTINAYYLPVGPSFVDETGICIRTATAPATVYGRDFGVTNLGADRTYLGFAPQPYFSEVAANELVDDTGDALTPPAPPHTVVSDCAIELYNPYGVALSLNGFHIKSADGTVDVDLTTDKSNGSAAYIPANGWVVITSSAHYTVTDSATCRTWTDAALKLDPAAADTSLILYRPYYKRGNIPASPPVVGSANLAAVDRVNYAVLVNPAGTDIPKMSVTTTPMDMNIYRQGGQWGPSGTTTGARDTVLTLGANNTGSNPGGGHPLPLPDRYAYPYLPTVANANQGRPFGMGEFARIIRVSNEIDSTTGAPKAATPLTSTPLISEHIANLVNTAAPYSNMPVALQYDAQILFDFYADPTIYASLPFAETNPPGQQHDLRAVRLLDQLSMVDRVSDFSINFDTSATPVFNDVSKLRIPGQINVNTASPCVLRAIPNMTDQMVANILGYRKRAVAGDLSCRFNGKDTIAFNTYPGLGIRSLAELTVPLQDTTAVTIDARDLAWGSICNLSNVRSDTFVVYGYLEAIKANPRYLAQGNVHNNGRDWYDTSNPAIPGSAGATGTTDDPNNGTCKNLRLGRLRWVAIVDRSFCNYAVGQTDPVTGKSLFQTPRIVAIKDLPR